MSLLLIMQRRTMVHFDDSPTGNHIQILRPNVFVLLSLVVAACGSVGSQDTTPPAPPTGITARSQESAIALTWHASQADDIAGYHVYRSTVPIETVSSRTPIDGSNPMSDTEYVDDTAQNGSAYYYAVTALDGAGNESRPSETVKKAPFARPPGQP